MFHSDQPFEVKDDKRNHRFIVRKKCKPPKVCREFLEEIYNHIIDNELSIDQYTIESLIDKYKQTDKFLLQPMRVISLFIKKELRRFYFLEIYDIQRLPDINKKYIFMYNNSIENEKELLNAKCIRETYKINSKDHMDFIII